MDILSKNSENPWSVRTENNTKHLATFPTGLLAYFGIPNTTVKLSHYTINDLNTLIQSVVTTCPPEINEPNIVQYQDMKQKDSFLKKNSF